MTPPQEVVQWLHKHFPKPRVDPDWLQGCCDWLLGDQSLSPVTAFPQFMERVKEQLLESDLTDSMLHNTGLRAGLDQATERLQGPPVLVQIISITEIGMSAFQLEQTRIAREERMEAGVGNVEGEEDGDVEVEGEGPMPKYPRGTLRFQLSDGATVLEAMEYRTLPQLTLGVTELGYKMQLKGTRIQNGMALLEPATVNLLGGRYSELEDKQMSDFKRGLQLRLGRPLSPEPEQQEDPPQQAARSPLREISPPLVLDFVQQHADDVDMEPRRRIPTRSPLNETNDGATSLISNRAQRPIVALPSRHTRTSTGSNVRDDQEEMAKPIRTLRSAHPNPHERIDSSKSEYFSNNKPKPSASSKAAREAAIQAALQGVDITLKPTPRQLSHTLPSPSLSPTLPAHNGAHVNDASFDFDFLNELDENQPPPPQTNNTGKGPVQPNTALTKQGGHVSSDDYGMADDDFGDVDFWENVDKVLENPMTGIQPPPSTSASGSTRNSGSRITTSTISSHIQSDVMEIPDSDEDMNDADDKENQPVPARHVRQRMDFDRESSRGAMPALSQRTGLPVIRATNPDDVIDISDSD